jgi:hypothetical protein
MMTLEPNVVLTVDGFHRLANFRVVTGEIVCGHHAVVGLHPFLQRLRKRPAIKPINSLSGDAAIRGGEIGFAQCFARFERHSLCEINVGGGFEFYQLARLRLESRSVISRQRESVVGQFSGGKNQFREFLFAEVLDGVIEGGQFTRNSAGQRAGLAEMKIALAVADEPIACGGGRSGLAAIHTDVRAVGEMDQQEAPAANAGIPRVNNSKRQAHRHRCVDRVAALF